MLFVTQYQGIPIDGLKLVDSSVIDLPLTGISLWKGLVLETETRLHYLHEVVIREDTKDILNGHPADPAMYWKAEEIAFREKHRAQIVSLVAERERISTDALEIVVGVLGQDPASGRFVWLGKAMDTKLERAYRIAIDGQGQEIDPLDLERTDALTRHARYGKLESRLFYLLPTLAPTEKLRVLLWINQTDHSSVDKELARRYPQVEADYYASGQPFTGRGYPVSVEPKLLERIRHDYNELLNEAHRRAAKPVADFLQKRGADVQVLEAFPGIFAELPVDIIQELSEVEMDSLSTIYLGEIEVTPQMDSVGGTIQVSSVWDKGYTGDFTGWDPPMRLGIMDTGNVDTSPYHPAFAGKWIHAPIYDNESLHAARVAGVMFGNDPNHPEYRGIAYGSTELISVGIDDQQSWQSINDGLNSLVDHNAFVINVSLNLYGYRDMHASDRVFDHVARYRDPTIVTIAGNNPNQAPHQWYINSPGKAYNPITVGGFEDKNTSSWGDDEMWSESCYQDPYIDGYNPIYPYYHRKPDVVAVAKDVWVIESTIDTGYQMRDGTSVAAPQVAGVAALLVQRYSYLRYNPETVKAIIMASAINNIEGTVPYDNRDGAGGISAAFALAVHERGGWAHHIITDINDFSVPSNVFSGNATYYDFKGSDTEIWDAGTNSYARKGERVRVVLCWNSNPDGANFDGVGTDRLSTDLDLQIVDPDGDLVPGASSVSYQNNCEVSDFTAPKTGEYALRVRYYRLSEEGPDLGLGMAWLPIPQVYLPAVMKSFP